MDWVTTLVLWTPVSVGLLAAFIAVVFVLMLLLWGNRLVILTWFSARMAEASTKHGFTLASSSTFLWLTSDGATPLKPVLFSWGLALYLIVKPDAAANPLTAGQEVGPATNRV